MCQGGLTLWLLFVIATGHEFELLEKKLEKTGLENLEVCKDSSSSPSSPLCYCRKTTSVCVCMCDSATVCTYHSIMTNLCLCCDIHVTCHVSTNHEPLYQLFILTKALCCSRICHHKSQPEIVHSGPHNCYWSLLGERKSPTHNNVFFWKMARLQAIWRAG